MEKQKALNELKNAKDVYVLMSRCTRMPYVVCDPETFDDEILMYFSEEDIKKEGARLIEEISAYVFTQTFIRWASTAFWSIGAWIRKSGFSLRSW